MPFDSFGDLRYRFPEPLLLGGADFVLPRIVEAVAFFLDAALLSCF